MNYEQRIQTLRTKLEQENLSAAIITSWDNLWYLTGVEHLYRQTRSLNQMVLVVPTQGDLAFIPTQGFSKAVKVEHPQFQVVLPYSEDDAIYPFRNKWQQVAEVIRQYSIGGTQVGVEFNPLSYGNYQGLVNEVKTVTMLPIDMILSKMRAIKDSEELDRIRRAARLTDNILKSVMHEFVVPGMTERQLAHLLRQKSLENGVEAAFTQIFAGYRNYFQNIESSDKKIEEHEIILVDWGVIFRGYNTDITRAYCLGKPNPKAVETCQILTDILLEAIERIKPGEVTGDIDLFVKKRFEDRGVDDLWIHRLGHSMGINFAESPNLAELDRTVIEPNMVFAVEPGIYYPDFGIRLEDNIIVHEKGCENMTLTPHEINIL